MINSKVIIKYKDIIVPVIGDNCFFKDGKPLQEFVVDELARGKCVDHSLLQQMKTRGYYGLTLLKKHCFRNNKQYRTEYENLMEANIQDVYMDPMVKEFLDTFKFPIIVTTSCFRLIESKLSTHYESISYQSPENNRDKFNEKTKTVYHIFGLCEPGEKCVTDENKLLEFIHELHGEGAKDLKDYINSERQKALFIIGSNLPDWLFRFFLYPMKGLDEDQNGFFLSSTDKIEDSLENFLESLSYDYAEKDEIDSILSEAIELYSSTQKKTDNEKRISHGKEKDIFISYASENRDMAEAIKNYLESNYGLKIWFDGTQIEDGDYVRRIKDGIENSAYFMPIVTKEYVEKHKYVKRPNSDDEIFKNPKLEFVQMETLYAELILSQSKERLTYSLPVVKKDYVGYDNLLTPSFIENNLAGKQFPPSLFIHKHMFAYEEVFDGKIDWNRYKTIEI